MSNIHKDNFKIVKCIYMFKLEFILDSRPTILFQLKKYIYNNIKAKAIRLPYHATLIM